MSFILDLYVVVMIPEIRLLFLKYIIAVFLRRNYYLNIQSVDIIDSSGSLFFYNVGWGNFKHNYFKIIINNKDRIQL